MAFLKRPSFRLGIKPSVASDFDMNNLTGTQKVMLASSRIFGYTLGGNKSSGQKAMARPMLLDKELQRMRLPVGYIKFDYDWLDDEREKARHHMMQERRKLRILMRGIKIGKKKAGEAASNVGVFETKK